MFHYRIKRYIQIYKKISFDLQYLVLSKKRNFITTWWFTKDVNFGDLLTPMLLRRYGMVPLFSEKNTADVICIGSILNGLPEDYPGYILGSGLIKDEERNFKNAKILSVRGELTRDRISAPPSTILGDPGLLADKLLARRQEKRYTLGIVPHYVDKQNERLLKISQKYKEEILIIDVQRNPKTVLENIDRCKYILSSSLHGLVAADSLGIPNGWIQLTDKVLGGGFKFQDYASAFNMKMDKNNLMGTENVDDLIGMTHPVSSKIDEVKNNLDTTFEAFVKTFNHQKQQNE